MSVQLLTDDSGLQVHKDSPGDVLSSASLTEEGVEGIISSTNSLVTGHLSVRLDPMFQAVQLPAGVADLDTSLANVDGDTLTLRRQKKQAVKCNIQSQTLLNLQYPQQRRRRQTLSCSPYLSSTVDAEGGTSLCHNQQGQKMSDSNPTHPHSHLFPPLFVLLSSHPNTLPSLAKHQHECKFNCVHGACASAWNIPLALVP